MKVLLVDDNRYILESASDYLRKRGVETVSCETALGVPAIVREHRPDVVVLDVMMPELGGATLAGYLRNLTAMRGVPILLYSAMDDEKLRGLAVKTSAAYVSKADGFDALHRAVVALASSAPAGQ